MKMNLPNSLVISRFILSLIVIILLLMVGILPYSEHPNLYISYAGINVSYFNFIALAIFIGAAYTDWLDGYLARKNNQVTNFGKIFDPLADKVLVNSVLIIFSIYGMVPIFFVLIFVIRDLMVDGLRINMSMQGKVLSAQKLGKYKTMFQFIGLSLLFVFFVPDNGSGSYNFASWNALSLLPLFIALIFSVWSGIDYYLKNWSYIISNNEEE